MEFLTEGLSFGKMMIGNLFKMNIHIDFSYGYVFLGFVAGILFCLLFLNKK